MNGEMSLDGYTKEKVQFNMLWVNIFSIIIFILFALVFGIPFHFIWGDIYNFNLIPNQEMGLQTRIVNIVILIIPLFIGTVLHELIHGIFYAIFAKNGFKSIKFGTKLKFGVAYCICKELMQIKKINIAVIMPAIILGFIPAILSLILGNQFLLFYGVLFIMGGAGDFLLIYRLLKEDKEDYFLDLFGPEKYSYIYRKIK